MNIFLRVFLLMILGLLANSCLLPNEKGKVSLSISSSDQAARDTGHASVTNVTLVNDQITITGSELDRVTRVVASQSGIDSSLSIISQSASELILSSAGKVALALNTLMSLTLEDAYGATVVEVTFNLPDSSVSTAKIGDEQVTTAKIADGAITAVKLDQMGAQTGQLLRWNGTSWVPADLDALTYAGTWDASVGGSPNPAAVGGEYYIVSADGTADPGDGDSRSWAQGDWIVFNDNTSSWDQISNTSDVTSFKGRTGGVTPQTGDYTWAMIDKTTSSIGDVADVDLSTPATSGQVLKFDGTKWIADSDIVGGGAGSVDSSTIANDSIVNEDVSSSAAIAWSKIDKTGASATDVGLGNVTNDAQIKASDLDTTATLGTSDTKVPSQNAVKSYVDNAVTGMGSVTSITGGAGLTDGPITVSGSLDVQVDGTTIEVATDALQVKALGIGSSHLAANAVTTGKVSNGAITNDKINDVADTKITTACSDGEVLSASSGKFVCASSGAVGNWSLTADPYLYYTGGNVGIGTATPSTGLEVKGTTAQLSLSNTNTYFQVYANDSGSASLVEMNPFPADNSSSARIRLFRNTNTSGNVSLEIFKGDGSITSNTRLSGNNDSYLNIDSGNVGIGTSTPGRKLDVSISGGTNYNKPFRLRSTEASSGELEVLLYHGAVGDLVAGDTLITNNIGNLALSPNVASKNLLFIAGEQTNSASMIIKDGGNVGIGTTSPGSLLDVNGTITATGFSGPISSSVIFASAGTASAPTYTFSGDTNTGFYSTAADTIEVSVNGANIFDMSSNGLVSATAGGELSLQLVVRVPTQPLVLREMRIPVGIRLLLIHLLPPPVELKGFVLITLEGLE